MKDPEIERNKGEGEKRKRKEFYRRDHTDALGLQ